MVAPQIRDRFTVPQQTTEAYNYEHFRTRYFIHDIQRTLAQTGVVPGTVAPDFSLPTAEGTLVRLSELRGKPVLLHFGSYTCPFANGSMEPLKKLHARWGDRVHFVEVLIRQAHPGPNAPAYHTIQQKQHDARRYQQENNIPWTVVFDDRDGRVHRQYGKLANPAYLIDEQGRVAFYNMWAFAPSLHRAIEALLHERDWVVRGGTDSALYLLPAVVDGWKGLRRGLPQSWLEIELAAPGMGTLIWLGDKLRPIAGGYALRGQPIPYAVKLLGSLGMLGSALAAVVVIQQRQAAERRRELERQRRLEKRLPRVVRAALHAARDFLQQMRAG